MDNERELKDMMSWESLCYQRLKAKNLEAHGYSHPAASIVKQDVTKNAMMPAMVKHDYRDIKIDASTTVTIDLEDIKKQLAEDFYRSQGLWLML